MLVFLQILQQIIFLLAISAAAYFIFRRVRFIYGNIMLGKKTGKPENHPQRLKNMLLLAFGQKKMFDRPLVGLMHFAVYAGFLLINIEILEIILDGLLGTHRLFAPLLGKLYPLLIGCFELLALAVLLTCVLFLIRRNVLKIGRFHSQEMKGWAFKDANFILFWEILLMLALFTMNATDSILQSRAGESAYVASHYTQVGSFWVSRHLIALFAGLPLGGLIALERVAWWSHILGIFCFAIYVTYSKHLHIALAFPNAYYADLTPRGKMENMDDITAEVKDMLGLSAANTPANEAEIGTFGAKDVTDLSRKNLLNAYTCTECGRCTSVCPANSTGKKLSPRKIMMDTRRRLEELGRLKNKHGKDYEDKKSLYGNYTTKEELMACTTCNACVEACPISINPLSIILAQRRYIAMEESGTPPAWNAMFQNIENNQAPWAFAASERFKWADEMTNNTNRQ